MDLAVILAAGLGTRMRRDDRHATLSGDQAEAARSGAKVLMPVAGRPFLDHLAARCRAAGLRRLVLVASPGNAEILGAWAAENGVAEVAVQSTPRGTADAVLAARAHVGRQDFAVLNGDNLYPVDALRGLGTLEGPGTVAFDRDRLLESATNIPRQRIGAFALLEASPDGRLLRIVEKPSPSAFESREDRVLVSLNCWRFDARIFAACSAIAPSSRGELELPDAVQHAIDEFGMDLDVSVCHEPVLDLSRRADVDAVERLLDAS